MGRLRGAVRSDVPGLRGRGGASLRTRTVRHLARQAHQARPGAPGDRVLVGEGKPQRFGTQFAPARDGVLAPQPVEAPEGLDARRAAVGLKPMAEYAQDLARMSGRKVSVVPLQGDVARHGP